LVCHLLKSVKGIDLLSLSAPDLRGNGTVTDKPTSVQPGTGGRRTQLKGSGFKVFSGAIAAEDW